MNLYETNKRVIINKIHHYYHNFDIGHEPVDLITVPHFFARVASHCPINSKKILTRSL